MTPKQIIALLVGLLATAVTAWKGPQAWGFIASGLTAIVILVSTLKLTPKEDEEYIQELETTLEKSILTQDDTGMSMAPHVQLSAPSRARFMKQFYRRRGLS